MFDHAGKQPINTSKPEWKTMQEEIGQLNRRTFLKFTGAAVAGVAGRRAHGQSAPRANDLPLTNRGEPSQPVVLKSADIQLILDRHDGLPYEYRVARGQQRMRGEDLGKPITVTICNRMQGTFSTVSAVVQKTTASDRQADFAFRIAEGSARRRLSSCDMS